MARVLSIALLWSLLLSFVPNAVSWRDSGEFLLSAYYLDITHPAGFPLYSQLANLFSLIPIGTVAWRINLFSALITVLTLVLTMQIVLTIIAHEFELSRFFTVCITLLVPCALLAVPFFLKQAVVSEVYVLNALLLEVLILLYLRFQYQNEARALISAAFIAGLALGNHLTIALAYLPVFLLVLIDFSRCRKVIVASAFAGMCGLLIYAYIPVRASAEPVLNTGRAVSAEGFIAHVSNSRDREMRSPSPSSVSMLEHARNCFLLDLPKLASQLTPAWLFLAFLGELLLLRLNPRLALLFAGALFTNWFFFMGWNPDPWIPIYVFVTVLTCLTLAALATSVQQARFPSRASVFVLIAILAVDRILANPLPNLYAHGLPELPRQFAESIVETLPTGTVLISEDSWFLLKYLRELEGLRDDLTLIYLEEILHPKFFRSLILGSAIGQIYENKSTHPDANSALSPFITFAARHSKIFIEPQPFLNSYLAGVLRIDETGSIGIERDQEQYFSQDFVTTFAEKQRRFRVASREIWEPFAWETTQSLDSQLIHTTHLLRAVAKQQEAIDLLTQLCLPVHASSCSTVPLNNLAVYLMERKHYETAAKILRDTLALRSDYNAQLRQNLTKAERGTVVMQGEFDKITPDTEKPSSELGR